MKKRRCGDDCVTQNDINIMTSYVYIVRSAVFVYANNKTNGCGCSQRLSCVALAGYENYFIYLLL